VDDDDRRRGKPPLRARLENIEGYDRFGHR
jgi:hypothetical protein